MSSIGVESRVDEPIAVVGMACRLPSADGPDQFWRLLRDGVDAITEVPPGRWPDVGRTVFRRGGFLREVDQFDAAFFGISPNEAAALDPQQRLILELSWEALEQARTAPTRMRGVDAGVFIGVIASDYALLSDRLGGDAPGAHTFTGVHRSLVANRVSYVLGLRGPSLTLDTGQSSSLVAVHLACEELRRGRTPIALAGGVNLNLLAETSAVLGEFGALSPDGRCHTFDRRANGYVRGEGGVVLVLKPLPAALADGDPVHSVILGGAVNNDGGGDGLTVPHGKAQQEVIRLAYGSARVAPADVQYVELHGTGTRVGDPIEAGALGATLGTGRPGDQPLLVGSVKTNVGHLEGAAGVTGLLKVILSLKHRTLPPSLNFETPNPDIPLADLGLDVVRTTREWPAPERRLVAGVSSFGVGGTNCHLVLAEPPAPVTRERQQPASGGLLTLSARSAEALRAQARALSAHLAARPAIETADVALSLRRTRARFEHRAVVDAADRAGLDALAAGHPAESVVVGRAIAGGDAFVFPGQGSQWPAMTHGLLDRSPVFTQRLRECADALRPYLDFEILDVLRGTPGAPDLGRVDVVQPALWAVMVSLAEVWRAYGVAPRVVIGHSQGEIAAATAIGALTLDDAARIVAVRSRLGGSISGGGMMSVGASTEYVDELLADAPGVSIAATNGPRSVVLSGPTGQLAVLQATLTEAGCRTKIVPAAYASHSPAVDVLRDELLAQLGTVHPRATDAVFVSTVTGEPVDTTALDAHYWYGNLRQPVRFADATRFALGHGCVRFIECSPHPLLLHSIEETAEEAGRDVVVVGTLRRDDGGLDRVRRSAGEAYVGGADIDWDSLVDTTGAQLTDLPTYPFQRRRHWLGDTTATQATGAVAAKGRSRKELRQLVLGAAAAVLGYADAGAIDSSYTFKDLGFDSVRVVELRNRLQTLTGLRLPTTLLFDFPTPTRVVETLHARLAGEATVATEEKPTVDGDPVAIIAMGCRFPGDVESPDDLWRLLATGTDAISELPTNRGWDLDVLIGADGQPGTCASRFGGFLHHADAFDAGFFGVSPREALAMDPQQRLLLEVSWETLERAGLDPTGLVGSETGVFVGAMTTDYGPRLHQPTGVVDGHLLTGTALSVASGRIAYLLGLRGPALTVDTACSSSLVALQLATQALRAGECSLALAGGVTLMANPGNLVEFSRQNGLAVDGRAKAFSAAADGTVFSEGAGMLLLERLSDAQRHGHPILAVIRGAAVNSDGASNGLTAPNGQAQEQVIRRALADAALRTQDIDAVEAHGTGTALGDPIEAGALLATYGQDRPADRPLWLGSIKSNIGHTQAAAGVAGVMKMVLALRHEVLPRTLHADEATTKVDWDAGHVRLLTGDQPWPADRPRRAAVSSFGISGTNVHVVLESPPAAPPEPPIAADGPLVWVFSARSKGALQRQAARLRAFAEAASEDDLAAAGPRLARRPSFAHRAVVLAADRAELSAALQALAEGTGHHAAHDGVASREVSPVFLFPGQGAQWVGMATELLATNEVFAAHLRECAEALRPYTGWSVLDVLTEVAGAPSLDTTDVVQPVLFALMVSLARLWRSAGVEPLAVVGHSQGEIAAGQLAGALSMADAARVVALRSQIVAATLEGTGGVLAVGLPAAQVRERLAGWPGKLWLAVDNGPTGTVIAGDLTAIDEFAAACGDEVQLRRTPVAYAAHTPHIEAVRHELLTRIGELHPVDTDIAICSSCAGDFIPGSALTLDYWYLNLAEQVSFDTAIRAFASYGNPLFIEVSPHPILAGAVKEILADAGVDGDAVGTLRRNQGGQLQFLTALAAAYVRGAPVAWNTVLGPVRRHVDLPTYAFDRQRFWLPGTGVSGHPWLDTIVPVAETGGAVLSGRLSRHLAPWLVDHAVNGTVLLPGTAFLDLALEAVEASSSGHLADLTLQAPLVLPTTGAVRIQVAVGAADHTNQRPLTIHSRPESDPDAGWTRHATGLVAVEPMSTVDRLAAWPPPDATEIHVSYDQLVAHGYEYGPAFQGLVAAWRAGDERYAEVRLPDVDPGDFGVHPALLDAALHVLVLATNGGAPLLPFAWSGVWLRTRGLDHLRVRLTGDPETGVSLTLYDATGDQVGGVDALTMRPATAASATELYRVDWVPSPLPAVPGDGRTLAVLDTDPGARSIRDLLRADGFAATCVPDLDALPDPVPPVVLIPCLAEDRRAGDPRPTSRTVLHDVLALVQRWLADERYAHSRLVFLASPQALTQAPVWGLVRSAESEHPGRFGLADVRADSQFGGLLAAALDAGETQCAIAEGRLTLPRVVRHAAESTPADLSTGTVLVTGGTSGLGALVATHLVTRHGVRDLLLVSRSGVSAPGAADLVERLADLGATVHVAACDVADRQALTAAVASRTIVGVVHAAGVLDDATVTALSPGQLDTVLRPKMDAAWLLHELTADQPLRAFVLFSSIAGLLGNPGQGNYAAANAFLDALAAHRRTHGRPAVSLAWGLWASTTGMTSGMTPADRARLAGNGVSPLTEDQGLALFDAALGQPDDLVAARWHAAALRTRANNEDLPHVLRGLVRATRRAASAAPRAIDATPTGATSVGGFADRIGRLDRADAAALLSGLVRDQLAVALGHRSRGTIDPDKPFREQGLDSLTAVELRNRLSAETGLRLPASLAFNHPTVTRLADFLLDELTPTAPAEPTGATAERELREALDRVNRWLADAEPDAHQRVAVALRAALDQVEAATHGDLPTADLDLASDEEIFAFIDTQL